MQKDYKKKYEIYLVFLVLLGLYLSLMETIVPKPFPWMKIGLSNISILIAFEKFGKKMAFEVVLLRILTQALMLGTLFTPSFIISLTAGVSSTLVMSVLFKFRKYFSFIAISIFSAFTHNAVQLIVVYFLLFRNISIHSRGIYIFILVFLSVAIITGTIIGYITTKLNLTRRNLITKGEIK